MSARPSHYLAVIEENARASHAAIAIGLVETAPECLKEPFSHAAMQVAAGAYIENEQLRREAQVMVAALRRIIDLANEPPQGSAAEATIQALAREKKFVAHQLRRAQGYAAVSVPQRFAFTGPTA